MVSANGICLEFDGNRGREGKGTPRIQLSGAKSGKVPESVSKLCLTGVSAVSNDGEEGTSFLA